MAMASALEAMASALEAMASSLEAMASTPEQPQVVLIEGLIGSRVWSKRSKYPSISQTLEAPKMIFRHRPSTGHRTRTKNRTEPLRLDVHFAPYELCWQHETSVWYGRAALLVLLILALGKKHPRTLKKNTSRRLNDLVLSRWR